MANSLVLGTRKAVEKGLSQKELNKFMHYESVVLNEGDKIACLKGIPFIETPLYTDATLVTRATGKDNDPLRVLEAPCIIFRKDGGFEAVLLSLNFLAGKDVYKSGEVPVAVSKANNLYYAYHTLDRVHNVAPALPIAVGCTGFLFDLILECKGEVTGYKELPLSDSFVETKGGYVNCDKIKQLFDDHQPAKLPETTRPMLVRVQSFSVDTDKRKALKEFSQRITGKS